jgi:hypothetical protein
MGVEPTHDRARRPCNSFEDCGAHRDPNTSKEVNDSHSPFEQLLLLCHALERRVKTAQRSRASLA